MLIDNLDDLPLAKCWEYRFVEELKVKRSSHIGFLNITMVLTKQVPASSERITLHFDQCVEFRPDRMFVLSGLDLQIEPNDQRFSRKCGSAFSRVRTVPSNFFAAHLSSRLYPRLENARTWEPTRRAHCIP
jgi:hypothetical protein